MTSLRWKSIAYATAIFIAGGVTGVCIAMSVTHQRMSGPMRQFEMIQQMRESLRSQLDLTVVQTEKIDPLIQKLGTEIGAIRQETARRIGKLIDSAHDQIAAELTPEQKRKLDTMERRRQQRFEAMERERHKFIRERPPFPFHHHGLKREKGGPQPGDEPGLLPPPPPPGGPGHPLESGEPGLQPHPGETGPPPPSPSRGTRNPPLQNAPQPAPTGPGRT